MFYQIETIYAEEKDFFLEAEDIHQSVNHFEHLNVLARNVNL